MRAKERAQNVGAGYSSGRKELPAREAGLVCAPESALPSWGCDRGWRAGAMLRSRSTQEMDGGENKVDEMKVARPPVFVNVHLRKVECAKVAFSNAKNGHQISTAHFLLRLLLLALGWMTFSIYVG